MESVNPDRNKRLLFSIIDDTDLATVENAKPVYDLLARLKIRGTKTVWPLRCLEKDNPFGDSSTLQDRAYAEWIQELDREGFEIAFHGASAGSNPRERTLAGLDHFAKVIGRPPTLHINHDQNRENLYWGPARFDDRVVRMVASCLTCGASVRYEGHLPESEYYWGDVCRQTIRYCRNLTFPGLLDLSRLNSQMPYRDPRRPLVAGWFSSCDAGDPRRFVRLLRPDRLKILKERGGICLLYVHFGAGFSSGGRVDPAVAAIFREVAAIPGALFLTASGLLDQLCEGGTGPYALTRAERRRMEWQWLIRKLASGGTG
jgi:hypothetical protein